MNLNDPRRTTGCARGPVSSANARPLVTAVGRSVAEPARPCGGPAGAPSRALRSPDPQRRRATSAAATTDGTAVPAPAAAQRPTEGPPGLQRCNFTGVVQRPFSAREKRLIRKKFCGQVVNGDGPVKAHSVRKFGPAAPIAPLIHLVTGLRLVASRLQVGQNLSEGKEGTGRTVLRPPLPSGIDT
jgi:hypothetical protein